MEDAMAHSRDRLSVMEVFGLDPIGVRAREAMLALRGDASVPPTKFGLSSLGILHPRLSVKTWLGRRRDDRRIPISNLFNHTQTPLREGWSVRKTQVKDFRGKDLTYDSHNGTDFAVPVGTVVVAPAPGRVLRVSSEWNRGGLKVFVDHGRGLVTTCNHLARTHVAVGDVVARGEPIALSGYSGIDALVAFPWSVPHVHFNVWLDGVNVDPFSQGDDTSLWIHGNDPRPADGTENDGPFVSTMDAAAMDALFERNYYPTRFPPREERPLPEREARLTLPFRALDFDGVTFADVSAL